MAEMAQEFMRRVKHIHFIGIGGAGMSGIAEVMNNLGYQVSGSDTRESSNVKHLMSLGIDVQMGHKANHVSGCDVVVYSSAVKPENSEMKAAHDQRIPVIPRAEMLAELMRFRIGIAVAGTHGKTTTTSLIASVLAEGGFDPTYVIGGLLNSSGRNAKLGGGKYLVAEADESDASFLHLQPVIAVLTNIDADHLETYNGDYFCLEENFIEFIHRIPFYGFATVCINDPGVKRIVEKINKPFITYGVGVDADVKGTIIQQQEASTFFRVESDKYEQSAEITLKMPGEHNVLNALAAISVAFELGISIQDIQTALGQFAGIGRRCDVLGTIQINNKNVLLIDDYAHHPKEISATLEAIRKGWPDKKITVIFQPHRYSRTRDLFDDFVDVLADVDALMMLEVYAAGETPIAGADTRSLCRAIRLRGHVDPVFIKQPSEIYKLLPELVSDGDILLVLGAGNIGRVAKELTSSASPVVH